MNRVAFLPFLPVCDDFLVEISSSDVSKSRTSSPSDSLDEMTMRLCFLPVEDRNGFNVVWAFADVRCDLRDGREGELLVLEKSILVCRSLADEFRVDTMADVWETETTKKYSKNQRSGRLYGSCYVPISKLFGDVCQRE
jgi:hypothetical protein